METGYHFASTLKMKFQVKGKVIYGKFTEEPKNQWVILWFQFQNIIVLISRTNKQIGTLSNTNAEIMLTTTIYGDCIGLEL